MFNAHCACACKETEFSQNWREGKTFLEVVRQNHTLGEKKPESQVAIKQWSVFKIFPHHSFEENIQGNNVNQPGSNFQNLMEPKETNIQKY